MNALNKIIIIVILLVTFYHSFSQDTSFYKIKNKNIFELNFKFDYTNFSLYNGEFDSEFGPSNIAVFDELIFIIDHLNGKIMKVNNNGIFEFSESLTNKKNLVDILVLDSLIYVISDDEFIYLLDINLLLKKIIKIDDFNNRGFIRNKTFISSVHPVYFDFSNKYCYQILENYVTRISENCYYSYENLYLGHPYKINSNRNQVFFYNAILDLDEPIQNITRDFYECKNFAFNNRYFIHFQLDIDKEKLVVYKYEIDLQK